MKLTEQQRREIVRAVASAVEERVNLPTVETRVGPIPCAIPPPGTPRYESTLAAANERKSVEIRYDSREIARRIDHTLLKPEATPDQIERLCREALEYGFATVCVNSSYVPLCARLLAGSSVRVCAVVGFPLGAASSHAKAFEAASTDAREIDMVLNVGRLKAGDYAYVLEDIQAVVRASPGRIVKVILECALLTDEEKIAACAIAREAGAAFVKTSTGFGPGGATTHDVALMRRVVGGTMGVKAAGGIRTREDAIAMLRAGACRLGTSASVKIVED